MQDQTKEEITLQSAQGEISDEKLQQVEARRSSIVDKDKIWHGQKA